MPERVNSLFVSCRAQLARVVSRIVPKHEVEDILQETYIKAFLVKSTDGIASPGAYMTRIARNLALDHVKRSEYRLTSQIDETDEVNLCEALQLPNTLNHVISHEEFAQFCEAVQRLPLRCRRAFELKKLYGYSQKEIAKEMNISESTVEKQIAQGMRLCISYMETHFGSDRYVNRAAAERYYGKERANE